MRNLIFTFLMLLVGFAAAAQNHWNPNTSQWDNYETYTAVISINGVEQASTDIEVAAFIDGVCRGSARLLDISAYGLTHTHMLFLSIWGSASDNGKTVTLKIYNHATSEEYTAQETFAYQYGGVNGDPLTPAVANTVPIAPTITTTSPLPSGSVGTAYSVTLDATGDGPITWSIQSGSLPAGLNLTGATISGTPTTAGTQTFSVKAANTAGNDTKSLSITISATAVAPTITTTALPGVTQYTTYSVQLTATGDATITWSLAGGSSLPAGLSLSPSGLLSGTPSATGTFNFTVEATNSAGTDSKALTLVVSSPPVAPIITTTYLDQATVGYAYSFTMSANGTAPITWAITSGSLPAGLSLSTAGVISGTPTVAGNYNLTFQASNAAGNSAAKSLWLVVGTTLLPQGPTVTSSGALAAGTVGTPYTVTLTATGDDPITWSLYSGSLPAGLSLSTAGVISGTPLATAVGTTTFQVKAVNATSWDYNTVSITITNPDQDDINAVKTLIESQSYTDTQVNVPDITAAKASVASVISSLNLNGVTATVVDGTFTAAVAGDPSDYDGTNGSYTFTVKLDKGFGATTYTVSKTLTITATVHIPVPPTITTTSLPSGVVSTAYTATLAATGDYTISWVLDSGTLPTGLSLTAAGVISGNPTTAGTFNFTVKATNGAGNATKSLSIEIATTPVAPTITTTSLAAGTVGTAYSQTLTATGTGTIAWSLLSGSLPAGLTLAGATISGTPLASAVGTANFTVQASNGVGTPDTKALSITITNPDQDDIDAAKVLIESQTFTDTQANVPDLASARTAVANILASLSLGGVSTNIVDGTFTAAVAGNAGNLSGTNGNYTFTVELTKGFGALTTTVTLTLSITATNYTPIPASITTVSLPDGYTNTPYSQTLTATGDYTFSWSLVGGALPTGLTLSGATISGTPTVAETANFTVQASNGVGSPDTKALSITIVLSDNDAISAALTLIESQTFTDIQANASTLAAARTAVENFISTLSLNGVTPTVVDGVFTPAVAGNASNYAGTNGSYTFTVELNRGSGTQQTTIQFTLTITATPHTPVPPTITTASLAGGVVGTPYSESLAATGDDPITWAITSGSLPAGLTLTGATISGTPTTVESQTFTVEATNPVSNDTKTLSITITAAAVAPTITTASLAGGTVGSAYSATLAASGTSPITWSIASGSLPAGLTLSGATISGTPSSSGTYSFTVKAANPVGDDTKAFSIVISPAPEAPTITTTSLAGATVGAAYSETLAATGDTPITWSFASGSLPAGLSLSGSCIISGTPTTAETATFVVQASNATGNDTKSLSIVVSDVPPPPVAPIITTSSLPSGSIGSSYSTTLTASGDAPVTWSLASGSLPAGLTLSGSGTISGTPSAVGTSTFTVKAVNSAGNDTKSLSIVISATPTAPTITTAILPDGSIGTAYTATLAASGDAPVTWSIASGSLPAGLTLSGATISGTPSAAGTSTFTVQASNVAGNATQSLSITILTTPPPPPTVTSVTISGPASIQKGQSGSFSATVVGTNNPPQTVIWDVVGGTASSINSSGVLSVGASESASTLIVRATSTFDPSIDMTMVVTVIEQPATPTAPTITTSSLPSVDKGTAYYFAFSATGTSPFTWSISDGSLPAGLSLSSDGVISGTPMAAGTKTFTVKVSNSVGNDTQSMSITVNDPTVSNEIITSEKALKITAYPNPVVKDLFIKSDAVINKVEIYSLSGLLLQQNGNVTNRISVSKLSSGIYILRVYTEKGVSVSRIVKK
ncbi:MAG: putative Ig domain-containing protein [Tannerella sp.]|jgi:hypothetical protein|nr:putative Ig domain-containing protein [Tannerella sp.]